MRIIIVKRIMALMRFTGRETDAQKQTARNERNVNFCSGWRIGLEIRRGVWYHINTEKKRCTQAFGMPEELPTSDAVRGQRNQSGRHGSERSIMVWVS